MKRVAVITGASSGLGREFAIQIDRNFKNIDEIWLIARRKDRLVELAGEINKPSIVVSEDITDPGFSERFSKMLKLESAGIKMLINCAGYGIVGPVSEVDHDVTTGMVDTNCVGLTSVISLTLPYMLKNSRIINIASSAAFLPQPDFAVYAATKSYVLSLSRALGCELRDREVYVTAVCPGPVDTEFFTIAEDGHKKAWFKNLFMANARDVVKVALKDSMSKKEKSIYGIPMNLFYILTKIVPHRIILKFYNFML